MFGSSFFVPLSIIAAIVDLVLFIILLSRHTVRSKWMGISCYCAGMVQIFYAFSIIMPTYGSMSVFSSLYFISVILTILSLLIFTIFYTKNNTIPKSYKFALGGLLILTGIDIVFLILNAIDGPTKDIVISYISVPGSVNTYAYAPHPLWYFHLAISYIGTLSVLVQLTHKALSVPKAYRNQFIRPALTIVFIVITNLLYIILQSIFNLGTIDYSTVIYTIAAIFLYQNCFYFRERHMVAALNNLIVGNIDQGLLLFDHEDRLSLVSNRAKELLSNNNVEEGLFFNEFLDITDIKFPEYSVNKEKFSFMHMVKDSDKVLRCDSKTIYDEQRVILGRVLTFTEMQEQRDLLTGFVSWQSFKNSADEAHLPAIGIPYAIVCDINNLNEINSLYNKSVGDVAISSLAELLRKYFPSSSFYIRGRDAYLFVLVNSANEDDIMTRIAKMGEEINFKNKTAYPFSFQYGISKIVENENVLDAIDRAILSMREKKLLDKKSARSQLLNSLITALQECDRETEQHVIRTREMGKELGKRIGLSDAQQSDLSLLCMLHDIGKIGIPLEILNKPGALSNMEWEVMKGHVEKGYQIASSSDELKGIADMIRWHHERWDGKGYPDGLTKESIPILSRIISIVDAYDAMTNDRPYRKAKTYKEASEEMRRCAGTQFDPSITDEFLKMLDEKYVDSVNDATINIQSEETEMPFGVATDAPVDSSSKYVRPILYSKYKLDEHDYIIHIDENFEALTGYTEEDVKNLHLTQADLIFKEDRMNYMATVNSIFANNSYIFLEHRVKRKDGSPMFAFCYGKRYYDSAEKQYRSEIVITDIRGSFVVSSVSDEERKKANNRLKIWEKKYRCDSLTGLLTHEAFKNDIAPHIINGCHRVVMMMMDLDHFKEYNDTFGHHAGDEFLIMVSRTLLSALGDNAYLCRIGGDEFAAAFLIDGDDDEKAYARASSVCNYVNQILSTENNHSTLSMGTAISSETLDSFNKLYEAADKALYTAKTSGRSRMMRYEKAE